eukprot:TRINITY_DN7879_c0_g1_i1.p1 TRINITY_DN7879_c0_g1~~TRINITY_DN7879_c0_g1_i1.p1  ORF type:complete len:314 (-),score=55.76 TRINITY_DN7879_c0_g1_i1:32-973(-)
MQSLQRAVLWVLLTPLAAAGSEICPAGEEAKDFDARAWGESDDAGFLQLEVVKEPATSPKTGREDVAAQEATFGPEELSFPLGRMYSRFTWLMQAIRPPHTTWRHVAGVVGACVATFSINFMDVVWLMPFLNDKADGTWNVVLFVAMSQILATVSIIIFAIKGLVEEHHHDGGLERSIDLATAFLLGSYGLYLLYEDLFCHAPSSPEKAYEDNDDARCSKEVAQGCYGRRKFMILCAVGGMDQIAVYIPVLTTQVLNGVELELGVLMSTLASVAMCLFLGRSEFLKRAVETIPLWLIVLALGGVSFAQYIRAS